MAVGGPWWRQGFTTGFIACIIPWAFEDYCLIPSCNLSALRKHFPLCFSSPTGAQKIMLPETRLIHRLPFALFPLVSDEAPLFQFSKSHWYQLSSSLAVGKVFVFPFKFWEDHHPIISKLEWYYVSWPIIASLRVGNSIGFEELGLLITSKNYDGRLPHPNCFQRFFLRSQLVTNWVYRTSFGR